MDNSQDGELYPIAVLIDELKHEDVLLRLNAIHRLSTIALALGPERTRDELIPFLDESVEDEDEVLTALSEELGNFVEYVGGPQHGHVLLSPLENLAAIEEPLVREKAVESLNKICAQLSPQQIEEGFIPMLVRLSKADWFTSKISACSLYVTPYSALSSHSSASTPQLLQLLRQHFSALVHDDTPMVRRQAATNLPKFVAVLEKNIVTEDVIELFRFIAGDDQDSVRLLCVDVLIAICEKIKGGEEKNSMGEFGILVSGLRGVCGDRSWRVRYMVADRFEKIAKAVDEEVVSRDLVPAFVKLLKDTEAEVRSAVAGQIPGFCALLDPQVLLHEVMPSIEDLVSDQSQHVRAALGMQLSGLAPILGKEETINHLLPMFVNMLKDEFPDVRLNIISKLEMVNSVIGIDLLSQSLLPAIITLAEDKNWRVRLAIISHIPLLASQLGVKFFDEKLSNLCMSWLGDTVFSIREASVANLRKLTEVFGEQWAEREVVSKVVGMGGAGNYLYRMTTCFAVSSKTLAPALSLNVLNSSIIPLLNTLSQDNIPNIRFNVAKSYSILIDVLNQIPDTGSLLEAQNSGGSFNASPKGKALIEEKIVPDLQRLMQDEDVDVRYFASMARGANAGGDEMVTSP